MKKQVGSFMVTYEQDRYLNQVLIGREYDFLSYYPTIIDIGANIGTFSLSMYDLAEKIYAIEPAAENIACLLETIKDNSLDKIKVFQGAIGDVTFVQKLVRNGLPGMGGWYLGAQGDLPVDVRTLRDFMDTNNINYADLVKIDVEGHEEAIFSTQFFPKDRIGTIIGEWHGDNRDRIGKMLTWLGFKFIPMPGSHFIARKR